MQLSPCSDGEQDREGLCQSTVANLVSPTKCNNKFEEALDPNLMLRRHGFLGNIRKLVLNITREGAAQ